MTKINILEFAKYDSKAIYEFLFLQNETEFEIIIPRQNWTNCIITNLSFFIIAHNAVQCYNTAKYFIYCFSSKCSCFTVVSYSVREDQFFCKFSFSFTLAKTHVAGNFSEKLIAFVGNSSWFKLVETICSKFFTICSFSVLNL